MKLNQEKCHLLVSGKKIENIWSEISHTKIWESPKQKLLGVVIDRDLRFDGYVSKLCRKTGQKRSALARLSHYMSLKQRWVLMKSFIEAQFGYCQLIWMFHTREWNRKVNHIYERALRIVYRDNSSSFTRLLKKITRIVFATETSDLWLSNCTKQNTLFQTLILDMFPLRSVDYNFRTQTDFIKPSTNTTRYGLKSLNFFFFKSVGYDTQRN